jgi:iron complex transport system permease protein
MPMTDEEKSTRRLIWLLGSLLLLALWWNIVGPLPAGRASLLAGLTGRLPPDLLGPALWSLRLPRLAATVLAGASLGMAGCLMQAVTRNPLASPSVLGVTAGGQLGLLAAVFLPPGLTLLATPFVFICALAAALLCFAIAGGWRANPLSLVLAGTVVTLMLSAVVGLVMVLFDQHIAGLALWSAGTLFQPGWRGVMASLPWFALAAGLAWRDRRGLQLLALGDDAAAAAGLAIARFRRGQLLWATLLAAVAVTLAGPIALVGLIAPNLLRRAGLRHESILLPASALAGALLLAWVDPLADWLASTSRSTLPLGAATALIGTPVLLWLIRRQGRLSLPPVALSTPWTSHAPSWLPGALMITTLAAMLAGLRLSPANLVDAWQAPDSLAATLVNLRAPRLATAMLAGALLASAGTLLQGVVRNPLAGPELLGLNQGAALAILLGLSLGIDDHVGHRLLWALLGAGFTAVVLVKVTRRSGAEPVQLALAGMALAMLGNALGCLLVAHAKLQVAASVTWLAGSSYGRDWSDAGLLAVAFGLLMPLAWRMARGLDLLGLGDAAAASLGLPVGATRKRSLLLATCLSAVAVAAAGPVGFVGLISPHLAQLLGGNLHRPRLALAAPLGALICGLAELAGETLLAPRELPFGLLTALVGAPYFLWLLARRGSHR